MTLSQNQTGRAFEYGVATSLGKYLSSPLIDNSALRTAKDCFYLCSNTEQENIMISSNAAAVFLVAQDKRLEGSYCEIAIQSDQKGKLGDVRDIVITNKSSNQEIGISAKNRHEAVKHSRLSGKIDFGFRWLGLPCSESYFQRITPIFGELTLRKRKGELWGGIPDKNQRFYLPILTAFQEEMAQLFAANRDLVANALVKYLLGKYDYYKVIKMNGSTVIHSFNIDGTLKWGGKIPLPTRIIEISPKPDTDTTVIMTFDKGWQLSFRIHNASSRVEASLKFDIQIVGLPKELARHVIQHDS